ncbi:MAG: NnrS family protein [Alphaproteobacteria bacterium HGW-Alphaproteobacteria-13]|jgi:uncharacterized protein involved in response to NO|nr:MAG: NnrS family protein [Alphaproteobacteria bacterium HGW-Alphaproteobacteria-13]
MGRSLARETKRTTAQIIRDYRGPALFGFGFRVFFLLAGIFAALAVPLWIGVLWWGGPLAGAVTRDWHVHEMLFGYTGAVVAGYMIIAGPNWTGRYPVAGAPVAALAALWLAGRAAMLLAESGNGAAMAVDAAFLPVFAAALWREQIAARNGKGLVPCLVVTALALANIAFHLRFAWPEAGPAAERLALGMIALLIAVMGGRLVPSFTRNWLAQRKTGREPAPYDHLDRAMTGLTAGTMAAWLVFPEAPATALLLAAAGVGTALRLARWRGRETWREPLVWGLHLAYLWLAVGFVLLGAAIGFPQYVPATSAIHALTAGAIGGMTLAMMARTTLSHTGRARTGGRTAAAALLLLHAAVLLRVGAPLAPDLYADLLTLSALLWSGAFLIFTGVYGPMLATRRSG